MLVDLGRNDVGRVAEFGSVRLTAFMAIERYSHVMHLVSEVRGRLRPELDAVAALAACFPAGTVSGAPKVRAMEIIDELEPVRRGPYAGAVGYVGWGARTLDTAIAIRTCVMKGGRAWIQAGAGIVADSDPVAEWRETEAKAQGGAAGAGAGWEDGEGGRDWRVSAGLPELPALPAPLPDLPDIHHHALPPRQLLRRPELRAAAGTEPGGRPGGHQRHRHLRSHHLPPACRADRGADGVQVKDLGSSNGTCINGARVTAGRLKPNDSVTFGKVLFQLKDLTDRAEPLGGRSSPCRHTRSLETPSFASSW